MELCCETQSVIIHCPVTHTLNHCLIIEGGAVGCERGRKCKFGIKFVSCLIVSSYMELYRITVGLQIALLVVKHNPCATKKPSQMQIEAMRHVTMLSMRKVYAFSISTILSRISSCKSSNYYLTIELRTRVKARAYR